MLLDFTHGSKEKKGWIHTQTLKNFSKLSCELQRFYLDSTPSLAINAHAHTERFQMTNRIMCHECETLLQLNLFQLMERHHFWIAL